MRNTAGSRTRVSALRARIALAMAMLAVGLTCAWSLAQNSPVANPTSTATPSSSAQPAAQTHTAAPLVKTGVNAKIVKKPDSKLAWPNLSTPQQQALAPLSGEWAKMNDTQKEKWLVISKKYAHMRPEEQQRLHDRMREWVKLTPAQRSAARTNYARAKKLDTEEKNEQWNKYQQLSAEQKKKLAQAKLPKRIAKLPATPNNAAPTIQLPVEALDRTLPTVPTAPISLIAPTIPPGSQASSQPAAATTPVPSASALIPASATTTDNTP